MWRRHCCLTSFFPIVDTCLSCEDIARQSCVMVPRWRIFGDFFNPAFPASCVQHISDLHPKFALGPHHVWKYGRHPICDGWDYHHTTTTILWPFFRDHPGEPVPEENLWTLWCKERLTEADTHDYPAWRHAIWTNQCPTAEIRRGKKERRYKKKPQDKNIIAPLLHKAAIKTFF